MNYQRYGYSSWRRDADYQELLTPGTKLRVPKKNRRKAESMRRDYFKKGVISSIDRYYYDKYGGNPYDFRTSVLVPEVTSLAYYTPVISIPRNINDYNLMHCIVLDHEHFGILTSINILEFTIELTIQNFTTETILHNNNFQVVVIPKPYMYDIRHDAANNRNRSTEEMYMEINNELKNNYPIRETTIPELAPPNVPPEPFHVNEVDSFVAHQIVNKKIDKIKSASKTMKFSFKANKKIGDITLKQQEMICVIWRFNTTQIQPETELAMRSVTNFKFTRN